MAVTVTVAAAAVVVVVRVVRTDSQSGLMLKAPWVQEQFGVTVSSSFAGIRCPLGPLSFVVVIVFIILLVGILHSHLSRIGWFIFVFVFEHVVRSQTVHINSTFVYTANRVLYSCFPYSIWWRYLQVSAIFLGS